MHWLGTDQLGRDLFYRVMLGARTSLSIAGAAVLISLALGLPLGLVSGFYRGGIDNVLMRLVDTLLSFPVLLLALDHQRHARSQRAQRHHRDRGRLHAVSRAHRARRGAARRRRCPMSRRPGPRAPPIASSIVRHVLPNILPPIIVQATISLAFAILAEAGLSFLGLGTQPPQSSWGLMIQASRDYLDVAPWTALVPGCAVALTVLGLNMSGDVLRDIFDPAR